MSSLHICESECVTCPHQWLALDPLCSAEGPCLVHTITGDLLRALEGPENCLFPRLISVSSEGHCIIYYERGRFSNFSINGKLLAQMEINDSTRVSLRVQGHMETEANTLKIDYFKLNASYQNFSGSQ